MVAPRGAHARARARHARDLGVLARRTPSSTSSGEFYRHTLMTPFFNPGPNPYGHPKVFLAAVGEQMTEVAGEVRRRHHPARLHDRAVRARGHDPRARARAGRRRASTRRLRALRAAVRRHRHDRGRDRQGARPARSSRSRSTARRPRTAACSSCTAGATCRPSSTGSRSRASGWRWASSSTTTILDDVRRRRRARGDPGADARAATATSSTGSRSTRRTSPTRSGGPASWPASTPTLNSGTVASPNWSMDSAAWSGSSSGSISRCPRHNRATRASRTSWCLPTMTRSTLARTGSPVSWILVIGLSHGLGRRLDDAGSGGVALVTACHRQGVSGDR